MVASRDPSTPLRSAQDDGGFTLEQITMMRSHWKRLRYRLEWLGLLLATKLIPLLSRRTCYHLARAAGTLLSFLDRQAYPFALRNFKVAFGDRIYARGLRKNGREDFQFFA